MKNSYNLSTGNEISLSAKNRLEKYKTYRTSYTPQHTDCFKKSCK